MLPASLQEELAPQAWKIKSLIAYIRLTSHDFETMPNFNEEAQKPETLAFGLQSYNLALSVDFDSIVAVAAIDWSVKAWFKWHLCIFATLSACCWEHLP